MDINSYMNFVSEVTSEESNNLHDFLKRISVLEHENNANLSLLMTSAIGLSSETGEFNEIVKKIFFQGKELSNDNIFHMKRELGDIFWYWVNACRSLHLDPNDVVQENVEKLSKRYSKSKFSVDDSENRKADDL